MKEWELNLNRVNFYPNGSTHINWWLDGELGIDLALCYAGPLFSSGPSFAKDPCFLFLRDIENSGKWL